VKDLKHKKMKTIDDFIKELQSISEDKRKLPLVIQCPNGLLTSPSVKMMWDDPMEMMGKSPDKMIITWQD
jgi:hypothetical protein